MGLLRVVRTVAHDFNRHIGADLAKPIEEYAGVASILICRQGLA